MSGSQANLLGLDTTYPAVAESVGQARRAVATLAQLEGAGEQDLERVKLAVSEAVSNAIIHAYAFEAAREVVLSAAVIDGELTVVVADDGCGFGSARESQGLGLGLAVMTKLCDSLTMSKRACGGTQLELRFHLTLAAHQLTGRAPQRLHVGGSA
jgi:stage II sporulation protein AB (anti-sigma F factor)